MASMRYGTRSRVTGWPSPGGAAPAASPPAASPAAAYRAYGKVSCTRFTLVSQCKSETTHQSNLLTSSASALPQRWRGGCRGGRRLLKPPAHGDGRLQGALQTAYCPSQLLFCDSPGRSSWMRRQRCWLRRRRCWLRLDCWLPLLSWRLPLLSWWLPLRIASRDQHWLAAARVVPNDSICQQVDTLWPFLKMHPELWAVFADGPAHDSPVPFGGVAVKD